MADADGDIADPVGALENPPKQFGFAVLQVAAEGIGAKVRDLASGPGSDGYSTRALRSEAPSERGDGRLGTGRGADLVL